MIPHSRPSHYSRTRDSSSSRYYRCSSRDHQILGIPDQICCRVNNLGALNGLGRGLNSLTARLFRPGWWGFGLGGLGMLGLPPCRLPLADLPETFRVLAIALVPAP